MVDTLQQTDHDPTEFEIMEMIAEAALSSRYGPLIAKVESYDAATQTASVTPVVRLVVDGTIQPQVTIASVPVAWPHSAQASLTFPLVAGDFGVIQPLMVDHDRWIVGGAANQAPPTRRTNALTDIVFRPGVRAIAAPLPPAAVAADGPVLRGAPFIYLGASTAADFIALASKTLTELGNIVTAFNTHTHPTAAIGPPSIPTVPMTGPSSVASVKVKIDS